MAAKFILPILLIAAFLAATHAADKPGQCMMHIMGCRTDQQDSIDCNSDSECGGSLKCCSTACFGRSCQQPDLSAEEPQPQPQPQPEQKAKDEVRPGYCPDPKVMRIACDGSRAVENCTRDNDCSSGKKCCASPCGWTECFIAGENPPASDCDGCPPVPKIFCKKAEPSECSTSAQCVPGAKCCPARCGSRKCVTTKAGECPYVPQYQCFVKGAEECSGDFSCPKAQKCCTTSCGGTSCMNPAA